MLKGTILARSFKPQDATNTSLSSTFTSLSFPSGATRSCDWEHPRFSQKQRIRPTSQRSVSTRAPSAFHELAEVSKGPAPLVFRSSSTNPYHNLSIEDYLLRHSDHSSRILFFYVNRPCVVVGRNQNPWLECNLLRIRDGLLKREADQKEGSDWPSARDEVVPIDLVRRRSGGGTVFHDLGNLNYSVIVPNDKDFNRRKHAEMVVRGLNKLVGFDFKANIKVNERHDIVTQKHGQREWLKTSGSAFKLTKGRALHHGTLLYSSPHLHQISGLLRSLGRDYIHAKGVESVRSKVGNLTWIESHADREKLKTAIIDSVMTEFLALYGNGSAAHRRPVDVTDEDCQEETNPAIAIGVRGLMTNDWRFGQTPRFDFEGGTKDGTQIQFQANRGIIETLAITTTNSGGMFKAKAKLSDSTHVHEIDNWKTAIQHLQFVRQHEDQSLLGGEQVCRKAMQDPALMKQLESVFPYFPERVT